MKTIEDKIAEVVGYTKFKKILSGEEIITKSQIFEIGLNYSPKTALRYSLKKWLDYNLCIKTNSFTIDRNLLNRVIRKMYFCNIEEQEAFLKMCKDFKSPNADHILLLEGFMEYMTEQEIANLVYLLTCVSYDLIGYNFNFFDFPEEVYEVRGFAKYTLVPQSVNKIDNIIKEFPELREKLINAHMANVRYYFDILYMENNVAVRRDIRLVITERIKLRGYNSLEEFLEAQGVTSLKYNSYFNNPQYENPLTSLLSYYTKIPKGTIVLSGIYNRLSRGHHG